MNDVTDKQGDDFFNLYIRGIGYLNRVREMQPKKGNPYLCCSIAALHGPADAVEKTLFDCTVVGAEAIEVVRHFRAAAEDRKVLIGFRLGDPWIDTFIYGPDSPKAGQVGAIIKARLLMVSWVKIDGEIVWKN